MPTIKGKIDSVNFLKSGTGAKGPWTMFEVTIAGQKFTGFGEHWQKSIGQEGEFEYKEEQRTSSRGTQYMSRTLQSPRKGGVSGEMLKTIDQKLDQILSILKSNQQDQPFIGPNDMPQQGPIEDDINVEDIPF